MAPGVYLFRYENALGASRIRLSGAPVPDLPVEVLSPKVGGAGTADYPRLYRAMVQEITVALLTLPFHLAGATALGRYLVSPDRIRYYDETPQVEADGMVIYFKSFTNERFGRFARVMLFRRNQGPVGLVIRIPLETEDDVHFRAGPVFAGLLWWGTDPDSERAQAQADLAAAWGEEPAWYAKAECGERAILGRRFDPADWTGTEAELTGTIADLLAAGLTVLDPLLPSPSDPHGAAPREPHRGNSETDAAGRLHQRLLRRGYRFSLEQVATFYAALKAKGFVILSGLFGTGKTKLAQEFAAALGLDDDHFLLEPVKPDWRDNTGLMGSGTPSRASTRPHASCACCLRQPRSIAAARPRPAARTWPAICAAGSARPAYSPGSSGTGRRWRPSAAGTGPTTSSAASGRTGTTASGACGPRARCGLTWRRSAGRPSI